VPDAEDGLVFTVGVFLHFEFVVVDPCCFLFGTTTTGLGDLAEDLSAIRRRASHWQSSSSGVGSSHPVAARTASRSSSFESPPASQMEKPRRPSDLMKEPLAVNARGESKETATPVLGLKT
jgi:hypothetical protein